MTCPKEFLHKKVTTDPVVQGYQFFNKKAANEWTFKEYINESNLNDPDLDDIAFFLRQYKQSLHSLGRMRNLDRSLKSYVGNPKKKEV